ncbi:hypothetical protein NOVOSPHI9U_430020 [Novosphingobium sp. 9U]|nr:hypothetical protein NOVOSPHI9U_430020 [Novosphingobium sp. 9U]
MRRWISSMNSTSPCSRLVSRAARSPALAITGPEVALKPTPSSRATIWASVVLPSPGGPKNSTWSIASRRDRADSMNTRKLSLAAAWPTNSVSVLGRSAASTSSGWRAEARRGLSVMALDIGGQAHPGVLALFVDGNARRGELRIGECADGYGDEARVVDQPIMHGGATIRTEAEHRARAFVPPACPFARRTFSPDVLGGIARLHREHRSAAPLAIEAMAYRHTHRLAAHGGPQLAALALGMTLPGHPAARLSATRTRSFNPALSPSSSNA